MVQFGEEEIDLSAVEQIVEKSQTRAIGDGILTLCRTISAKGGNGGLSLRELIQEMESKFDAQVQSPLTRYLSLLIVTTLQLKPNHIRGPMLSNFANSCRDDSWVRINVHLECCFSRGWTC